MYLIDTNVISEARKGERAFAVACAAGLPGVGQARAARLLERFGSVRAVVQADPEVLAEVEGIGRRTVRRISWSVEEPRAGYTLG